MTKDRSPLTSASASAQARYLPPVSLQQADSLNDANAHHPNFGNHPGRRHGFTKLALATTFGLLANQTFKQQARGSQALAFTPLASPANTRYLSQTHVGFGNRPKASQNLSVLDGKHSATSLTRLQYKDDAQDPFLAENRPSPKGPKNPILKVETLENYKAVVADEHEHMVVVKFYADYCRSCKAIAPLFKKMANQLDATDHKVKFVEVPLTPKTGPWMSALGVKSIPFGHIYHPKVGLVEEQSINRKKFKNFDDRLSSYIKGYCDLSDGPDEDAPVENVPETKSS